jgi:hypothetical protein
VGAKAREGMRAIGRGRSVDSMRVYCDMNNIDTIRAGAR